MSSTRMIICEAAADDAVKEIVNLMQEHVRNLAGMISHSILVEEGGLMVVLITDWPTRQDCLAYHASRAYRQVVAATQHMLMGNYVVKLFQNRTEFGEVTKISEMS
jgi:heme-degrading monooxygenase HmoA